MTWRRRPHKLTTVRLLCLVCVLSTVVVLVVTWLTPRTEESIVDAFYRKVRPPGLWRGAAERTGDEPERPAKALRRGAWLVLTTAASLYMLLIGFTKLMLPPPDSWLVTPWIFIALGVAIVPLWWRMLRAPDKDEPSPA